MADYQQVFVDALLNGDQELPSGLASVSSAYPERRFNVYRNNVFHSLGDALEAIFPVVKRLVGKEFFRAIARAYIAQAPPSSPVLMEYGETFGDFLSGFEPVGDVPYLADVARLEWLQGQAFYARDAEPLSGDDLAPALAGDASSLTFVAHPAMHVLTSRYPVVSIWRTNTHDDEVEEIDLDGTGESALIVRPALDVAIVPVPEGVAIFHQKLKQGETLGEAVGAALSEDPTFDLTFALTMMLEHGAFVDWSV